MRKPGLQSVLAVAVLALAGLAVAELLAFRSEVRELQRLLLDTGVASGSPQLLADLRRAPGSARSQVRAARALLAAELAEGPAEDTPAQPRRGSRLELARRLALEALDHQPASWQAWMVVGGANYRASLSRPGPRTAEMSASWERPLRQAHALAPGQAEPLRLLASAYLTEWPRLGEAERAAALPVVERALADPTTFRMLFAHWVRAAPSRAELFGRVPDERWAWQASQEQFARDNDWERWCQAHERLLDALERDLSALLAEHRKDRLTAPSREALDRLHAVPEMAPPSYRFAPYVVEALSRLSPSATPRRRPRAYRAWLEWALTRCLYAECPFERSLLTRLEAQAGPLQAGTSVLTRALRGEPVARDGAETAHDAARARLLALRNGRRRGAPALPEELAGRLDGLESSPFAWWEIDAASPRGSELGNRARGRLAELAAGAWSDGWNRAGRTLRRELLPERSAAGLTLEIVRAEPDALALAVSWNQHELACRAVVVGSPVRLPAAVAATPVHVEVTPLAGARISELRLELGPRDPATGTPRFAAATTPSPRR